LENSMLKMGDLLISIMNRLVSPASIVLTHSALIKELKIMEEGYGI
jgi:hypothetical protein